MRIILWGLLVVALLYGALLGAERLTTQELTRLSHASTEEAVCLMWKPRFLRGDGLCYLDLLNAQGQVVDTAKLGVLDTAFNALQQFGQLGFHGNEISVAKRQTGELVQGFVVRDGHLSPAD